jgi:hypothetical protein
MRHMEQLTCNTIQSPYVFRITTFCLYLFRHKVSKPVTLDLESLGDWIFIETPTSSTWTTNNSRYTLDLAHLKRVAMLQYLTILKSSNSQA